MKYSVNKGSTRDDYPELTIEATSVAWEKPDFVYFLTKSGKTKFIMNKDHILTVDME